MGNEIQVLSEGVLEKYSVKVRYIQAECLDCHHTWGIAMPEDSSEFDEQRLVCRDCAAKKVYENMK
jgi:hypothetical protein